MQTENSLLFRTDQIVTAMQEHKKMLDRIVIFNNIYPSMPEETKQNMAIESKRIVRAMYKLNQEMDGYSKILFNKDIGARN